MTCSEKKLSNLAAVAILFVAVLFSLNVFSQTPAGNSGSNVVKSQTETPAPASVDPVKATDNVKKEIAEEDKSYVTGADGQKVYFLTAPSIVPAAEPEKKKDTTESIKESPQTGKPQGTVPKK